MAGETTQSDRHPLPKAYWGQLAALLATALALVYLSWTGYRDALDKAEITSGSVARVSALSLDTTLNMADMLLAESAAALAPHLENPLALRKVWEKEAPRLRGYLTHIPQVDSIRVFDASGEMLLSTGVTPQRINIADRPHFQRARDNPTADSIVSDVVVSRSTNRQAVVLLRPIRSPEGRFLGVISSPIDLSCFQRVLSESQLGTDGAAAIRRSDTDALLIRHPNVAGGVNKSPPEHPAHPLILAGKTSGSVIYHGEFDGIERIVSFQTLQHFPLYVVVGVSRAGILSQWQQRALVSAALVVLALLSVGLFYRRMARNKRVLEGVLDTASEVAIIATDAKGVVTLFNHGAEKLLGYSAADVVGKLSLDHFYAPDESSAPHAGPDRRPASSAIDGDRGDAGEWRCIRKDGSIVTVSQIVTPIALGTHRRPGLLCVAHNIDEQKRVAGLRTTQNQILEMIASGAPLPRILNRLLQGIEARAGGLHCAIHLFEPHSATLRHAAAPSLPEDYGRTIDGLPIGANREAGASAAFLHDAILTNDIQIDPRWAPLHGVARAADLHACWSTPILDSDGGLLGTFAIYGTTSPLDVTSAAQLVDVATHTAAIGIVHSRAAAALEASEKRMRVALHAASMEAYEYERATDRVHRDSELSQNWGLPAEISGRQYVELIHPDDRASHLRALRGLTAQTPDYAIEYRLRNTKGDYIWVADWASATFGENGHVDRIFGVCRNISSRKALEDELRQHQLHLERLVAERTAQLSSSEASIRLILESTADGVYGVNTHGCVTFISPAACRILGLSSESVIGKHIHPIIHHHHADGQPYFVTDCPTNQTLRKGEVVTTTDEVYWHADGHPVPVIYSTHPMIRDGRIVGAVVSFMDVTERRAMEDAREQALQAAEKLASVKSEFLANMSHEIRTPLNGILGFARMGFRDSADKRTRDAFSHILDSGTLLLGVVNDILDFSKIEAGKLHLEAVAVDLPALLKGTVGIFGERAENRRLNLHIDLAPSLPAVCKTDPLRLGQILSNLLSNALKFTEKGEVSLYAACEDDHLVFRVSDTGIGIDACRLSQLFQAFEQADSSTTRRFGGTGLGLAITKQLVDLFGGTIQASSQYGRGSSFEVRLPYLPGELPALPAKPAAAAPSRRARLAGLSVLAAEDNEVNQLVLEDMLLSEGARLEIVGNGRAAVERIAKADAGEFQAVLMDIQMPEMDGYEATRRIRELAPELPVIGQTAHAMAEEKTKCAAAGMVDHIAKPLDLDALVAIILRHARRPAATPEDNAETPPAGTVDLDALNARYADRPDFILRLLGSFATSHTRTRERLRKAVADGDMPSIADQAGAIRSAAGNIMAWALSEQADRTERAARNLAADTLPLAEKLLARLDATLADIARN